MSRTQSLSRTQRLLLALSLVLASPSLTSLRAQLLPEGHHDAVAVLPTSASNVLALPADQLAWFDGSDLWLEVPSQPARSLLHFAMPVFGSFTIAVDSSTLLFGESTTHGIWLVPLNATPPSQPIANVVFNYDAVLLTPGTALVSAKTGGFSTLDNEVIAVDLATGNTQMLAQLPGASGPIALASNGDLYYATSSLLFPTPPGSTTILRFRRAIVDQALAQNVVLGLPQAEVVFTGIDAAADLAIDDDGDLFFTDWWTNTIGELNDATGPTPWRTTFADYATTSVSASTVQFVAANTTAVLEPFQPEASMLCVHETAWGVTSQLRTVHAQSAIASCSVPNPVPTGPFTLQVAQGPANGFGLVAIAFAPSLGAMPLALPGFEAPLHWDTAMTNAFATWFVSFDAAGIAQLTLQNPGIAPVLSVLVQTAFVNAAGTQLGATLPLTVHLDT
ncbi:MAG: hypothetical protein IT456_18450 [Planctomycetes bacterium]|nr:hypothetical protein [Planctomycetota bacterium]